jgi:transposase
MHDGTFGTFKTSRRERVDIRVGVERRRRWSREDKLRIVRQTLEPNAVVTDVARRNEVSASLIYVWRRQALAGLMEGFQRIEVVSETRANSVEDASLPMIKADSPATTAIVPASRDAPMTEPPAPRPSIEVTLPGGASVRIDGAADVKVLRAVLGALVER